GEAARGERERQRTHDPPDAGCEVGHVEAARPEVERLVAQLLRVHEQPAHNRNVATVAQRELVLYATCKLAQDPLDHTRSTLLSFRARGVLAAPLREAVAQLRPVLGELAALDPGIVGDDPDRKSTRLNSSHVKISYAVFCLKKKK